MAINKLGKDLKLYVDASLLAYANTFKYTVDRRIIKTNTIDSGEWDTYIQYGKGWTGSADALICRPADSSSFSYIKTNVFSTNASIGVVFTDDQSLNVSSTAFVTSFDVNNGGNDALLTYSINFTGTSALA
jgi:hypothetical protein